MNVVIVSRGEYQDYCIKDILVGEKDPIPILDSFVKQYSECTWNTYEDMLFNKYLNIHDKLLREHILNLAEKHLLDQGFKPIKTTEIWRY